MADASLPSAAVRIELTADRGRVVVASKSLAPGALACEGLHPYAAVVADAELESTCHHCFAGIVRWQSKRRCVGCEVAHYCSETCEAAAAHTHGLICNGLRKLRLLQLIGDSSDNLRLLLAVLAQRQAEFADTQKHATAGDCTVSSDQLANACVWANVLALEDNASAFELEDTERQRQIETLCKVANELCLQQQQQQQQQQHGDQLTTDVKPSTIEKLPLAVVVSLFRRLQCNAHAITGSDGAARKLGVGMFPGLGSAFNHSCSPNCTVHFEVRDCGPAGDCSEQHPPRLVVRTIAPVASGEELTITYTDLYALKASRRGKLAAQYKFDCACPRCAEGWDQEIEGVRCSWLSRSKAAGNGTGDLDSPCGGLFQHSWQTLNATTTLSLDAADAAARHHAVVTAESEPSAELQEQETKSVPAAALLPCDCSDNAVRNSPTLDSALVCCTLCGTQMPAPSLVAVEQQAASVLADCERLERIADGKLEPADMNMPSWKQVLDAAESALAPCSGSVGAALATAHPLVHGCHSVAAKAARRAAAQSGQEDSEMMAKAVLHATATVRCLDSRLPNIGHLSKIEALRFLAEALFDAAMAKMDTNSDDSDSDTEASVSDDTNEKRLKVKAAAVDELERSIKALGAAVDMGKVCRGDSWPPVSCIWPQREYS
eukprot:SAG31_NODE_977_length_10615_cov_93.546786_1_plen_662_part_00